MSYLDDLVLVGDEGWTRPEWEAEQRRLTVDREYRREYRLRNRERINAYFREYRRAHPEQIREYRRRWDEKHRASKPAKPVAIGALHSLACVGPHRSRKSCSPIPVYSGRLESVA